MSKNNSLFQRNCTKALENISETDVEEFKSCKDEESRIKLIFKFAKNIPIDSADNGKNLQVAQRDKAKGNELFSKKDYKNALSAYSSGILKCPQNSDESKELLSILVANRSATLFELNEFRRVLNDIDYVLEVGKYPQNLQYKIWLRKARCYDALNNEKSASESYDQSINSLQFLKLTEDKLREKIKEIENIRNKKIPKCHIPNEIAEMDIFSYGKEYIAANDSVTFEENQVFGRYARAVDDIETGTLIIQENPHCAVLSPEQSTHNCQNCFASLYQPYACPACGSVAFCSSNCEKVANRTYHRYECKILPLLASSGASVNCFMALRIITQKSLKFFKDKRKILKEFLKGNGKRVPLKKIPYRSDDYDTVFFLCRNEHLRKKEELIHFSCMSIYLLGLLKLTNYFGYKTQLDVLTEDEQFIAALLLRHLQILQFSSHEISELQNAESDEKENLFESGFKSAHIGAGLYPTLALFNHSCDPSIVRYNIGNKVYVRTIKPIKAGDVIYENYGPIYTTTEKEERQKYLQERYLFECLCTPCIDFWPTLEYMNENELRLPCKTPRCPFVFVIHRDDFCPYLKCDICNQSTGMLPFLKGLMVLQDLLPQAESLYSKCDYMNALKVYTKAINILYEFTSPPCPDIVKVQQRMRTCIIHLGNKASNYSPVQQY